MNTKAKSQASKRSLVHLAGKVSSPYERVEKRELAYISLGYETMLGFHFRNEIKDKK